MLTRPTLAGTSPSRPESAKTDSSPWERLVPIKTAASERPRRVFREIECRNDWDSEAAAGCSKRLSRAAAAREDRMRILRGTLGSDLNDAITKLGGFFNVLLIGVADVAATDELQKLQSGLRLTAEGA